MLTQKLILKGVMDLLKASFTGYTVYANEVVKGYKTPCFFVKCVKTRTTETVNTNGNSLTIAVTYFPSEEKNNQLEFVNVFDIITEALGNHLKAGDRVLTISSITSQMTGEQDDILQVLISVSYKDYTGYDGNAGFDTMTTLKQTINLVQK